MTKIFNKNVFYSIVSALVFMFLFIVFFVNQPNVYADTSYTYSVSDINFKTASSDGYFTISKSNGSQDGATGKISYYMSADSSLAFTFTPTNKIITSVSSFNFYGEYDIDNYGTMEAKSVTYSYFFGGYTSTSENITSEYTFSVDQNQLNARKPGSITFIITANEELQLRVGGNFVFNAKDANVDVNFDAQGGSGGTSTIKATPGSAMPSITLPTRTGYSFDGYYTGTNGGGTKYYNANGTSANNCPSTSLKLYAKWVANQYTVTLNMQNGSGGSSSVTATYNSAMPTITVPTRTGYTFGGYYTGTNGSGTQYYNANGGSVRNWDKTSNTTLYAKWTANQYTVTLNMQNGSGGSSSVTATYASTMPTITVPTRTGYTFGGYYTETNGSGTQYYNANGGSAKTWDKASATTLYAKWTANTYTVTFNNQNGTGGSNSVTATYDSAMPSATMPTRTGYTFAGYYDNTSGGTQYYTATGESAKNWDKAGATTLYARWTFNPDELIGLINDIGDVNYPNSRESLVKAEEVYNVLEATDQTAFQTTYSNYYKTLTDARIEYDAQKAVKVQEVIDAINDIGEVKYPESKEKIVYAEGLYNALDENEKNTTVITNYGTLTGSRTTLDDLRANAINDVMDKIDAITTPLVYPNSNSNINTARTAFDALHADDKNVMAVTNYQDLLDSEAAYYVANEVNEIGNSEDTQEFRDKVSAVRNEYNNLTSNQKAVFPVKENEMLNDYEAAIIVMDLINAIGDVEVTAESKALIDAANESYEALTATQKLLVVNYDELISDNTDYDEALAVVNKIDDIGDGEYSEEKQALITDARESFNALTEYQQSIVYNSRLLYDKEVEATKILIDNIGSVQYTPISKSLIDIASASYNALDSNLKLEVTNYRELQKANNDYNKVDTCVNKVNSLGDLTYSETSDKNIKNARELIDALTADQKAILPEESENTLINY